MIRTMTIRRSASAQPTLLTPAFVAVTLASLNASWEFMPHG